jgi:hypothetical protein
MNHVAINVPADKIEAYYDKLVAKGVKASRIINHDDSPMQASMELTPSTFVRSIYFYDPDGIALELAAWTRTLGAPSDVAIKPAHADDKKRYLEPAK